MFISNGSLVTKTPVSISQGSGYFPWMPPMSNGWPSAYAGIYSKQLWVYTVVTKRARATARLPLPVYLRDDKNRPRVDDHPMALLLANPNPGMSLFDLLLWTSSTFDIYGDTFWFKRRDSNGTVVELYPYHPSAMTLDESGTWTFDNGTRRQVGIVDRDLVRFRGFNPDSLTRGLSALEPLRATLENEWNARTATSSFWQRGARPGLFLTHKDHLSQPAQARLKAQFDAVTASSANTGSTIILEEGLTPQSMMLTAEEAQYIETRKLNREEVCAAYDIPPPVVHILDHATFSNITEQMRSMYRDTMAPHLKGFEAAIETDLRRVEWGSDDVYAEFLMDDVLRGDFETRQTALAQANHMTIAEKRRIDNLPYIEGTDRIFLNSATLPLDAIDHQYGPPGTAEQSVSDADAEVIPLAVARAVIGRLAWQQNLAQVEVHGITEGVDPEHLPFIHDAVTKGGTVLDLRRRILALAKKE